MLSRSFVHLLIVLTLYVLSGLVRSPRNCDCFLLFVNVENDREINTRDEKIN